LPRRWLAPLASSLSRSWQLASLDLSVP
jgi:hypothetical protein